MTEIDSTLSEFLGRLSLFTALNRILILGDPHADICHQIRSIDAVVDCFPDLQSSGENHHCGNTVTLDFGSLMTTAGTWDLVIALTGFQRMHEVRSAMAIAQLHQWIARNSRYALLEAPRIQLAPDLHDFGPYKVDSILAEFEFFSEVDPAKLSRACNSRAVIFASHDGLLIGEQWITASSLTRLNEDLQLADTQRVRTYRSGAALIKLEISNADYFERREAIAEADFIETLSIQERQELALPEILEVERGRACSAVIREYVPGRTLVPGECKRSEIPVSAILDLASTWASRSFFHNDLRPWNLIWTGTRVVFIDFADSGRSDLDVQALPQVLALSAALAGLLSDELPWGEKFEGRVWELLSETNLLNRWSTEDLIQGPWLALPHVRTDLETRLTQETPYRAAEIIELVITTVMEFHERV